MRGATSPRYSINKLDPGDGSVIPAGFNELAKA